MATTAYATGHHHQPGVVGGGAGGGPPPPGGAVPDSYFTESRKGEINELRNLLRGFASERDPQRKRDIIKKVREILFFHEEELENRLIGSRLHSRGWMRWLQGNS
jgi:hypothetical protein